MEEVADRQLLMSNILQHLLITNSTHPLRMATDETSWKNSLVLLVLSPFPFHLVQPIYNYIYYTYSILAKLST